MEPRHVLALCWLWHALFTSLVVLAVSRSAHTHCGWPRSPRISTYRLHHGTWRHLRCIKLPNWPLQGRWLLALFMATLALMMIDITYTVWTHQIIDRTAASSVTWRQVILRLIPAAVGPWLFRRIWTVGLINDDSSDSGEKSK